MALVYPFQLGQQPGPGGAGSEPLFAMCLCRHGRRTGSVTPCGPTVSRMWEMLARSLHLSGQKMEEDGVGDARKAIVKRLKSIEP